MATKPSKRYKTDFDEPTKQDWANKILSGETTIAVARKQLGATTWQVAAWVGIEAEKRVQAGIRFANVALPAAVVEGMVEEKAANPASSKLTPSERDVLARYMGTLIDRAS